MGTTYKGSFKQLGGLRNAAVAGDQTQQAFFSFPFASDYNGTHPDYIANVAGTPTFTTSLGSSSPQPVMKLDRGGAETVTIDGEMGFMHGDFSMQFWLYIPGNGAFNGDYVVLAGNRVRFRATGSGNAYADFSFLFLDGASSFTSQPVRLDVDHWNHITIGKATGVGPDGAGPQKYFGTRIGVMQNGSGAVGGIQRFDGTYAQVGAKVNNIASVPTEGQYADSIVLGGANMYISDFAVFDTCLINLYNTYLTNFVPPRWAEFN